MAILKSHNTKSLIKEAVVLDLSDLGRQAQRLREQAEQRAAQIIRDAEQHAQQLVQGAEARGFEQGRVAGMEQGLAEGRAQGEAEAVRQMQRDLAQLQKAWRDVATQWDQHLDRMQSEGRQAVLALALNVAEKLVHRVAQVDPSVVEDQLAAVLAQVLRPLDVTVAIHPDDRPLLEKAMPRLLGEFTHLKHVQLSDDPRIARGGCIASFGQGRADATLATQIQRVVQTLLPDANALHRAGIAPVVMQHADMPSSVSPANNARSERSEERDHPPESPPESPPDTNVADAPPDADA